MNVNALNCIDYLNTPIRNTLFSLSWALGADSCTHDTLNYSFHSHSFWEAHFITKGNFTYGFANKDIEVKSGQFIIVRPRLRHKVQYHSEDFQKTTVAFEVTDSKLCKLLEKMSVYDLNPSCLNAAFEAAEHNGPFKSERVIHHLYALLFSVAETVGYLPDENTNEAHGDVRVTIAKSYVNDNFNQLITCQDVARYSRISQKQLGRLFKRYEGISVLGYIHKVKYDNAYRLLTTTSLSIKDIALQLGFEDSRYFSKFILRISGMTPSEIRTTR